MVDDLELQRLKRRIEYERLQAKKRHCERKADDKYRDRVLLYLLIGGPLAVILVNFLLVGLRGY